MRRLHRLTAAKVAALRDRGKHADGGNLYLRIDDDLNKTWGFRYTLNGTEAMLGLGSWPTVSLAEAREKAIPFRKLLAERRAPKVERDKARAAERAAAARLITFRQAAERFLVDRDGSWRNEQHRRDFRNSLASHIMPVLGGLSVGDIDTPAVLKVLEPMWRAKPDTASRCRSRIELVLDWAAARGYRDRENPAKWRGHLDHILPAPKTLKPLRHHPALAWQDIPAFMADLGARENEAARALEFTILTAARISEVLGATWDEFDFANRLWNIPAKRMKSFRPHVVPLSPRALEILTTAKRAGAERPFPSARASVGAYLRRRMKRTDITTHGFRSSFSTWCAEATRFETAVREASLAHAIGDKVERAYQRGALLDKRRKLMEAWARYCAAPPVKADAKVVALRG